MRDILKEYNWDWKLWAMMKGGEGMENGTLNELMTMLQFMPPDMQERMMRMVAGGKAGELMVKENTQYYFIYTRLEDSKVLINIDLYRY